jgi:hypothetical protein
MKLINRGIIIVKPKRQFLEWLNQLPDREAGVREYSLEEIRQDCTAFLLPDVVSEGSVDFVLEPIKTNLFEMELADWTVDPSNWPTDRTPEAFDRWFDIEFHSMVWDLLELPIQSMDEEQTFDPLVDDYPEEDELPTPSPHSDFEPDLPFKRQDSVVVRSGAVEPNRPHNDLSGWQGRVIDFIEGEQGKILALVEWDSFTLEHMPGKFILERAEHTWEWEAMALDVSLLEPTKPRDSYHRVERVQARISAQYFWPLIPSAGKRIAEFLTTLDPGDDRSIFAAWQEYLPTRITLPFEACIERNSLGSPALKGDFVTVVALTQYDALTGVLIQAKYKHQLIQFPLANLIVLNETSPNYSLIDDYKLWFDYTL